MKQDQIKIALISAGNSGGFDQSCSARNRDSARAMLYSLGQKNGFDVLDAGRLIYKREEIRALLQDFLVQGMNGLILHCACFSSGELGQEAAAFLQRHPMPVIVWGVPDPTGGPLPTNSFCLTNFFTSILYEMGVAYKWVFGAARDEIRVQEPIAQTVKVLKVIKSLENSTIGLIGSSRVPGFFGSNFDELQLKSRYGVSVNRLDLSAFFAVYEKIPDALLNPAVSALKQKFSKCTGAEEDIRKSVRAYLALKQMTEENGFDALALRCWPEIRDVIGTELCVPFSLLGDDGIPCSDEADVPGALSMMVCAGLSENELPPTLLDMVSINESQGSVGLWHCGASPFKLCRQGTTASLCPHAIVEECSPEAPKGLTTEELLAIGEAAMMRIQGTGTDRILAVQGEIIESPMLYRGAYGEFKPGDDMDIMDLVNTVLVEGMTHHYCLAYGNLESKLVEFSYWKDLEWVPIVPFQGGLGAFGSV